MKPRFPLIRVLLHPALALLVLASNAECQVSAAEAVRVMARPAVNTDGTPHRSLNLPPCENESGCMCRGATLAVAVDASPFAPRAGELLAVPGHDLALQPAFLLQSASAADLFRPPPLSGRMLRARIVSFLS